jgi:hypothetical protein
MNLGLHTATPTVAQCFTGHLGPRHSDTPRAGGINGQSAWVFIHRFVMKRIEQDVYPQIGINYTGQRRELRGCVNDAKNVRNFLISEFSAFYPSTAITNEVQIVASSRET